MSSQSRALTVVVRSFTAIVALCAAAPQGWGSCTDAQPGFHVRGVSGSVSASVVHDDGTGPALYVGGLFASVGEVAAANVARFDGSQWSGLGAGLNGWVQALVSHVEAGVPVLYAAGYFGLARWDGQSWTHLGSLGSQILALAVFDDGSGPALYVSGMIQGAWSVNRYDGSQWTTLGSGFNGMVNCLQVHDDGSGAALYVGGDFTQASGLPAQRMARWNGQSWSTVGVGLSALVDGLCEFDDGTGPALFATGLFEGSGASPNRIARWDGTHWSAIGSGLHSNSATGGIAMTVFDDGSGPALYVGGNFFAAGTTAASNVARWYGGADWFAVGAGVDLEVHTLIGFQSGGQSVLYAGGLFTAAGSTSARGIARWDGMGWTAAVPDGQGLSNPVRALLAYDDGVVSRLYAGGNFTAAGAVASSYVAAFDGVDWSAMNGLSLGVAALALFDAGTGPQLYAAGSFSFVNGASSGRVARWDGGGWTSMGMDPGPLGSVSALAVFDGGNGPELFAGGSFNGGGSNRPHLIARWNGSSWNHVGTSVDDAVHALMTFDDGAGPALYAGGSFNHAGGQPAARVARWDGQAWSAVGSGLDGPVYAFAVHDDGRGPALYAGGSFTQAGGLPASGIARWDGASWTGVGGGVTGGPVYALAVYPEAAGEVLVAGGAFTGAGGSPVLRLAAWDGAAWQAVGAGVPATVTALAVLDDGTSASLYVGGSFVQAGIQPVGHIFKMSCISYVRGDCDADGTIGLPDIIHLLVYLFGDAAAEPHCLDACDANDDERLDLTDVFVLLGAVFGVPPVPLPAPIQCGADPGDLFGALDCRSYGNCP